MLRKFNLLLCLLAVLGFINFSFAEEDSYSDTVNNPEDIINSSISDDSGWGMDSQGSFQGQRTDGGYEWSSSSETSTSGGKDIYASTNGSISQNDEGGFDWQISKDISAGKGGATIDKSGSVKKDESGNIIWDSHAEGDIKNSDAGWTTDKTGQITQTENGAQWSGDTQIQTNSGKTLSSAGSGSVNKNDEGGVDWQSTQDIATGSGGGAEVNKSGQVIKTDSGAEWSTSEKIGTDSGATVSSIKSGSATKTKDGVDWQSTQDINVGQGSGPDIQTEGSIIKNEDGGVDFSKEKTITTKDGKTITIDTTGSLVKDENGYHWEKSTDIDVERPESQPQNQSQDEPKPPVQNDKPDNVASANQGQKPQSKSSSAIDLSNKDLDKNKWVPKKDASEVKNNTKPDVSKATSTASEKGNKGLFNKGSRNNKTADASKQNRKPFWGKWFKNKSGN